MTEEEFDELLAQSSLGAPHVMAASGWMFHVKHRHQGDSDMADNGSANYVPTAPFSVWTHNDSPEWLAKNTGVPLVRLAYGMIQDAARALADRLIENYDDRRVEVWDVRNVVVWAEDPKLIGKSGNWRDRTGQSAMDDI